ncbi:hypothetical protein similar to phage protein (N4 Gp49/phage Sf6 gene 66) family [Pseudomonas phage KPP25]|uniref:Uncharacterized protein n=1 Tax=Pseudomonas phage KPP25 TaxID=1462608 RepID=X5I2L0_BPKP2|nr:hypothetical protein similar to phage protein (N4 Gp49/phage Sf6 gene 66) family [Pseudomonas phage KPP25]BAO58496.1 hypothetical protein similar to phage protein (N4 Gp49/phage Sf6 gene 66) family [Pseudomonas phage KPP25]
MSIESESKTEQEMKAKGLTAPRIPSSYIQSLFNRVVVRCHVVEGTTTTVAVALLDGEFTLATAISACVDPNNFNREIGERIATGKALDQARDKLWELAGFRAWMDVRLEPNGLTSPVQE